jgi:hypothetical protein
MRKTIAAAVIALVIPSLAVAAGKPTNPGKSAAAQAKAKVMYVLKGKVTAYTAAGSSNGSITLTVSGANHHAAALKGQSVTLVVSTATKVAPKAGVTVGDNAVVKVRLAKSTRAADLVTALAATTSFQVVDQGSSSTSTD